MKKKEKPESRTPSLLDLDLSHEHHHLKSISKEIITKFVKLVCERICNKSGYDLIETRMNNSKVITVMIPETTNGETVLSLINKTVAYEFGDFIEKEMKESRKLYDRNITLFESTVDVNRITIYCLS